MNKFDKKFFKKFIFSQEQVQKNLANANKDFNIARKVNIVEVKFNYTYTALIKIGIALFSYYDFKAKSVPGHHIKIIDQLSILLKNHDIANIGHVMRNKRNLDFYGGGIEVTLKETREYLNFVDGVLKSVKNIIVKKK